MPCPDVFNSEARSPALPDLVKTLPQDDWSLRDSVPFVGNTLDVSKVPDPVRRVDDIVFQVIAGSGN